MNSKGIVIVLSVGCILTFAVETLYAQIKKGDKELSVAASFMARKAENQNEFATVFNVPIRFGIFAARAIEFEPELLFTKFKEEDTGFVFSANLAYHFSSGHPQQKIVPYIFGGLGVSNTFLFLSNTLYPERSGDHFTVLNLGAGIKQFIAKDVALRLEYRFQDFMGNDAVVYHHLFLGLSVFFN
ncbi:MAG TPA: hypothetical protein PK843_14890 [bacterium]|nr:hypothetical protein [bacterium]HPN35798.1 hypothetical protein [bacterium]